MRTGASQALDVDHPATLTCAVSWERGGVTRVTSLARSSSWNDCSPTACGSRDRRTRPRWSRGTTSRVGGVQAETWPVPSLSRTDCWRSSAGCWVWTTRARSRPATPALGGGPRRQGRRGYGPPAGTGSPGHLGRPQRPLAPSRPHRRSAGGSTRTGAPPRRQDAGAGPDHSETLITCGSLATVRGACGDVARAVAETEQLLQDRTRVLGPDHPTPAPPENTWRTGARSLEPRRTTRRRRRSGQGQGQRTTR